MKPADAIVRTAGPAAAAAGPVWTSEKRAENIGGLPGEKLAPHFRADVLERGAARISAFGGTPAEAEALAAKLAGLLNTDLELRAMLGAFTS